MFGLYFGTAVCGRKNIPNAKNDFSGLDSHVPTSINLNYQKYENIENFFNHSLFVHHFYKLFWVRSAKFRASIILSFYNHIIGIISFLYSQSETSTMTSSFNESWQQSKNEGYSDNKTDHINVPIVKIMNFEA